MKALNEANRSSKLRGMTFEVLRGILVALAFTIIAVLIFALILKSSPSAEGAIPAFNIIIKIVSIVLGSFFSLATRDKGWMRGLITGVGYMFFGFIVFSMIDGSFELSAGFLLDLLLGATVGLIMGIILVNLRK